VQHLQITLFDAPPTTTCTLRPDPQKNPNKALEIAIKMSLQLVCLSTHTILTIS
jgi:hypothetical protein